MTERISDQVGNYLISTNVNEDGVWETVIFDKAGPRPWPEQQHLRGCFLDYEWFHSNQEQAALRHIEIVKWVSEKKDLGARYRKFGSGASASSSSEGKEDDDGS